MKHTILYGLLCIVLIISVFNDTFVVYAEELDEEPSESINEEVKEETLNSENEKETIETKKPLNVTEEQTEEKTVKREDAEAEIEELPPKEVENPEEEETDKNIIESPGTTDQEQTTEPPQSKQQERMQPLQNPGLIDVRLLTGTALTPEHQSRDGVEHIILRYRGGSLLNLQLLNNTYAIFYLPTEIINVMSSDNLSGSYNTPGILGLIRNRGNFESDEITIDGNQVYMEISDLVVLSLGSYYEFTLEIELKDLPPTQTGEYVFYSEATKQLVNLALISGNPASGVLEAPQLPDAPVITEPIYTTDTTVTGTGEPNTTIRLQIGTEEASGTVDNNGFFSVTIPRQGPGTVIEGTIINDAGHESDTVSVIVVEPPDTTPPDPPEINDVYSNDTVVTGSGEPNTSVIITIGNTSYEGTVDAEGMFSVDIPAQTPDTLISSVLIDEAGNSSERTETSVIEATIAFHHVPDTIAFETTVINSGLVRIPRTDPNWSLEVIDTRGTGSPFSIVATATPLTLTDGSHILSDALVYINPSSVAQPLNSEPVEVFTSETGETPISTVSWAEDEGPFIEVNPVNVHGGAYQAAITWNIIDAP